MFCSNRIAKLWRHVLGRALTASLVGDWPSWMLYSPYIVYILWLDRFDATPGNSENVQIMARYRRPMGSARQQLVNNSVCRPTSRCQLLLWQRECFVYQLLQCDLLLQRHRHAVVVTTSLIRRLLSLPIDAVDNQCTIQLLSRYVPDHDAEIVNGASCGGIVNDKTAFYKRKINAKHEEQTSLVKLWYLLQRGIAIHWISPTFLFRPVVKPVG